MRSIRLPAAVLAIAAALAGCSSPKNPSFDLTLRQAREDLEAMRTNPKPLERPLVIISGYGDPGLAAGHLGRRYGRVIDDDRILTYAPQGCDTFDGCRAELIERVEGLLAESGGSIETTEIDVIGNSMGGLLAAYAAADVEGLPRLRIVRLFTISSPFQGAQMADAPAIGGDMQVAMRRDSAFIAEMNERIARRDYELLPYVRLGDTWVGAEYTAPAGEVAWWTSNAPFEPAHMTAFTDPRIRADIARRLRGETPYTTDPPAPLPE